MINLLSCLPLRGLVVREIFIVCRSLLMFGSLGMGLVSWVEVHCGDGVCI